MNKGDRVILIKKYGTASPEVGQKGTIIGITDYIKEQAITVEFDNEFEAGHAGPYVVGKPGHCWNFHGHECIKEHLRKEHIEPDEYGNYW